MCYTKIYMEPQHTPTPHKPSENRMLFSVLSYVSILCLIPLLNKDQDPFVRFHMKQGLALLIIEVVASIAVGFFLFYFIARVVLFLCFLASCYGAYHAYTGKQQEVPGLSWLTKIINV